MALANFVEQYNAQRQQKRDEFDALHAQLSPEDLDRFNKATWIYLRKLMARWHYLPQCLAAGLPADMR